MTPLSHKKFPLQYLVIVISLCLTGYFSGFSQHANPSKNAVNDTDTVSRKKNFVSPLRTPAPIADIPLPVNLAESSNDVFTRVIGSDEILRGIPGFFIQSMVGGSQVRFSSRGWGNASMTGSRGVTILLDGIPESDPDSRVITDVPDFNTINRIEVTRGNNTSLYPDAVAGVIDFQQKPSDSGSYITQFNQFGSGGLAVNGIKASVKSGRYRLYTDYNYTNFNGFREHSLEYRHRFNLILETKPTTNSELAILGYYNGGTSYLPGSLTKAEFDADPYQADPAAVDNNERMLTGKGRVGLRFTTYFGKKSDNTIEALVWGSLRNYQIAMDDYQLVNQYRLGGSVKYSNLSKIGKGYNNFSIGFDLYAQPTRVEHYENLKGEKGGQLTLLQNSNIRSNGIFISDGFGIIPGKLTALLTTRVNLTTYISKTETPLITSNEVKYLTVSPRLALNYKLNPNFNLFASYGSGKDHPAENELTSCGLVTTLNEQLESQRFQSLETGTRADFHVASRLFARNITFQATVFYTEVKSEIIPYQVFDTIFYSNSAQSGRFGFELDGRSELLPGLNLALSLSWNRMVYGSYLTEATRSDSTGNNITQSYDYKGNSIAGTPPVIGYASLAYTRPLGPHLKMSAGCSYQYVGNIWTNDANTVKTNAYQLLHGYLGADLKIGHFSMMLSGGINNIFNQVYVGYVRVNATDGRFFNAGAPRNYFCSFNLGYHF